ncbi:hypothetical protein [Streptomyces lasiicapitis]|uniref:hypothetical protein n=1 Tax=Streptomyces lasiicapitis TaxID=1923961 RepID=UPI0036604D0A
MTERRESAQYDGTNGAVLTTEFLDGTYTVLSEDGTSLVLRDGEGSRKTIPLNGWVVCDSGRALVWYGSAAAYEARWVVVSP